MRIYTIAVCGLMAVGACSGAPRRALSTGVADEDSTWKGWSVVGRVAPDCPANEDDWRLATDKAGHVLPIKAGDRPKPRSDELPGDVPVGELGKLPRPDGPRRVLKVTNGWLVGADAGEFGGGAFFIARDKEPKRLDEQLPEPIRWIERFDFGILGVAGRCDGDGCARSSQVYRIDSAGDDWRVVPLASFEGCPLSIDGVEGASEALLVTCTELLSVSASSVTRIGSWKKGETPAAGPATAARDASGSYYVSFGRFIGRIAKGGQLEPLVHCER